MQPSEQGGALFRPLSLIHRNTAYEVWHAVSPAGRPAVLVGLPTAIAGYKPARDAFAAAVNWALHGPYATIEVLGHDGYGAVPWIAILPEARVVSANAFVQYLVSIEPPTQQMTPPAQVPPPAPVPPSAPVAPFAGQQQPVAPGQPAVPAQPVVPWQQQPFVPAQWTGTQQPPASSPPVSGPPVSMPSVSAPPASGPPVYTPPVSGPPVSMPSVSAPPASGPPVSMPSASAAQAPVTPHWPVVETPPVSGPPVSAAAAGSAPRICCAAKAATEQVSARRP